MQIQLYIFKKKNLFNLPTSCSLCQCLQYLPDNGAFTQCEQGTSIHTGDWWLCDESSYCMKPGFLPFYFGIKGRYIHPFCEFAFWDCMLEVWGTLFHFRNEWSAGPISWLTEPPGKLFSFICLILLQVLQLIYVSRNGLCESEMFAVVPSLTWNFWAPMCDALVDRHIIVIRSGVLVFRHDEVILIQDISLFSSFLLGGGKIPLLRNISSQSMNLGLCQLVQKKRTGGGYHSFLRIVVH